MSVLDGGDALAVNVVAPFALTAMMVASQLSSGHSQPSPQYSQRV
ncbi:hypothetical protein [Microbacterium sp.]